jgi:aspartyl-tRNA(Asn)/glutamyl-tRNA(Gln) amidotransferase subunit A
MFPACPCHLSIADAGRLFRVGKLSAVELTQAFLTRIGALDSKLHSYITVSAERALAEAKQAESDFAAGRDRGPMQGIPYGLKDLIDTAGIATTSNSRLDAERIPDADAVPVAKLRSAGAVLLGKHSCHEFAGNGPCFDLPWPSARNPWSLEHNPGGSSTGSGAAVAAGLAMAALGTDVGGSVRNPASFCGGAGVKATYGRVSRRGTVASGWTLDHVGPLAWTVEDCAIVLGAISGYDPEDPGSADEPVPDFTAGLGKGLKGLRIGWLRAQYEEEFPANDEMRAALVDVVAVLRGLGATVEEAALPPLIDYLDCRRVIGAAEFYAIHERDLIERSDQFGRMMRLRSSVGATIRAVDYIQAQRKRLHLIRETDAVLARYDAFLSSGQYGPAPVLADASGKPQPLLSITGAWNLTGHPALVQPMGFSRSGLPLSLQLIGRYFDEATLFRIGRAYELATDWHKRRPPVP